METRGGIHCRGRSGHSLIKLYDLNLDISGNDILPHLGKSRPNLSETHTALLLSSYLQAGLPSALIEVSIALITL